MKGKLTAAFCEKTTKPGRHNDGGGLYFLVKEDGRKTWVFRFDDRITRKQQDMGLGRYGKHDVTLAKARTEAGQQRELLRQLKNPIEERRRKKQEAREALQHTFKSCTNRYIEANKASWRNQKHTAQWSSTLNTYAASLMELPVADINDDMVVELLEKIWSTKTETATRVRQRIESVLDWATAMKYRSGLNPARWKGHLDKLLPKPTALKKVQHRPALPYHDAGAFMAKLREADSMAAKALELQILTATRPGETVGAQWTEFNLKAKVWTIPAERMKADKEHEIPLSAPALQLIKELPHVSDFLFPGVSLDKPMTTAAAMKLIKRIHPGITAHGFRSTFRDWCADQTAYPREVIEHALAHQLKDKAEASYQRSTVFPKRIKLMAAWSKYCDQLPGDSATVTPIRKGAKS